MLCAVGCEEQGGDDVTPNDKPGTEQPEEKPDDGSSDTEQPGEKPDDGSSDTEQPEEQKPENIFSVLTERVYPSVPMVAVWMS